MPGPFPTVHQADAVREDTKLNGCGEPETYVALTEGAYSDVIAVYPVHKEARFRVVVYKPDGNRVSTDLESFA